MNVLTVAAQCCRSAERGQVLPLVALSLAVILGAGALAVDVGYVRYQQQKQQIATDSAAVAGASELTYTPGTLWQSGALLDAKANGYDPGADPNVTITVNKPPSSGAYSGVPTAVEVIITKTNLPTFFAGAVNAGLTSVTTRAVGAVNLTQQGCIYALKGGMQGNGLGGGGVQAPTCGILVNGPYDVTGNGAVNARFIAVDGTIGGTGSSTSTVPVQVTVPTADPCGDIVACAFLKSLTFTNGVGCTDPVGGYTTPPTTLLPGHYCYTDFSNSKFQNVTLSSTPLNGSTSPASPLFVFDVAVPNGVVTGSGVTIYNNVTDATKPKPNSTTGVTFNGSSAVALTSPSSGPTAGMVYFQPASNTGAVTKSGANGTVSIDGGIYAPTANFTMNGNLPSVSVVIVGSVTLNGSGMNVKGTNKLTIGGHAVLAE